MVSCLFIGLPLCWTFEIALMKRTGTKMSPTINRICIKIHDCVQIGMRNKKRRRRRKKTWKRGIYQTARKIHWTILNLKATQCCHAHSLYYKDYRKSGKTVFQKCTFGVFRIKYHCNNYYVTNNLIRSSAWIAGCHVRLFSCSVLCKCRTIFTQKYESIKPVFMLQNRF